MAQIGVHGGGGVAAFGDGPDDERLATAHVAGREDTRDGRHVAGASADVAASIERDPSLGQPFLALQKGPFSVPGSAFSEPERYALEGA